MVSVGNQERSERRMTARQWLIGFASICALLLLGYACDWPLP